MTIKLWHNWIYFECWNYLKVEQFFSQCWRKVKNLVKKHMGGVIWNEWGWCWMGWRMTKWVEPILCLGFRLLMYVFTMDWRLGMKSGCCDTHVWKFILSGDLSPGVRTLGMSPLHDATETRPALFLLLCHLAFALREPQCPKWLQKRQPPHLLSR